MANNKSLDEIFKQFNKSAGEEVVTTGLQDYSTIRRIPFTSPRMNYCTFGGIPVGKLTEFFGEEHGGKTTTALDVVANYQQMDGARQVLYVDAENSLNPEYCETLGVDVDSLKVVQPKYQPAEDILQLIIDAVASGEVGLWILDSAPALSTAAELDKDMNEKTMCGLSALMPNFCRKITMLMSKTQSTGIVLNQLRDKVNSMYGGTQTPCGKALKHFEYMRIDFSRGKFIDVEGNELKMSAEAPAGNFVMFDLVKSKSCPPTRRTGFYTLNYTTGIDYLRDLVKLAIKLNIIVKSGSWFSVVDMTTGEQLARVQGEAAVYEFLAAEENSATLFAIEAAVQKIITG